MGVMERVWDTLATVVKMNDKVERMAATIAMQQGKIEDLTGRVIRLETVLEIALANRGGGRGGATVSLPTSKRQS